MTRLLGVPAGGGGSRGGRRQDRQTARHRSTHLPERQARISYRILSGKPASRSDLTLLLFLLGGASTLLLAGCRGAAYIEEASVRYVALAEEGLSDGAARWWTTSSQAQKGGGAARRRARRRARPCRNPCCMTLANGAHARSRRSRVSRRRRRRTGGDRFGEEEPSKGDDDEC